MAMLAKRLLPYAAIFLGIQTLLRLSLLARSVFSIEFATHDVLLVLAKGLWFDCIAGTFCLLPIALAHLLIPAQYQGGKRDQQADASLRLLFTFIFLFDALAEHLFWTEFTTRFNFIAVDYLVYTNEVIGNIMESYPVVWLILVIAVMAALITRLSLRHTPLALSSARTSLRYRVRESVALLALCALLNVSSSLEQSRIHDNAEAEEIAANGIYNLFYAFWHNEISYKRFYATESDVSITHTARSLLTEENASFVTPDGDDLTRRIKKSGPEQRKNVMLVVMESLSADYMGAFGNANKLTPTLDKAASEGLFFTKTYATGTRTVRGLEALTLSIPPTPGQSILRRPNNANLFSLGFVFKDRGYDTRFIYGGYGYFDNMNAFFSGNGFDIVDRTSMNKEEITFANVWGVCDEDMFRRAIREADAAHARHTPFMHLIMTTSNHRPFTYPPGKIDIEPHSGRLGGVKYADYSIGKLLEEAKTRPWFEDTVFVFVSDHTAGAGGKAELNPEKYHIPMIFYAPGFIKPQRFDAISSQIDMAPILLGMLNFSYNTKFYGEDLLNDADEVPHAFISNYQKVALVQEGEITILGPKRSVEQYSWPDITENSGDRRLVSNAIGYYQSASWWRERYQRIPTKIEPLQ